MDLWFLHPQQLEHVLAVRRGWKAWVHVSNKHVRERWLAIFNLHCGKQRLVPLFHVKFPLKNNSCQFFPLYHLSHPVILHTQAALSPASRTVSQCLKNQWCWWVTPFVSGACYNFNYQLQCGLEKQFTKEFWNCTV